MKKYFLSICIIMTALATKAQQNGKFFIEPSVGMAFPVGAFKGESTKGYSNSDGWAKPGWVANLAGGYRIKKNYGVVVLMGFQQNPMSKEPLSNLLKSKYLDSSVVTTGNYKLVKLMAGAYITAPLSSFGKCWVEVNFLGGACKVAVPQNYYAGFAHAHPPGAANNYVIYKLESKGDGIKPPATFAGQVNASFRYRLSKIVEAFIEGGYFYSAPSYRLTRSYSEDDGPWMSAEVSSYESSHEGIYNDVRHPVNSIIATGGVRINLN